MNNVENKDRRRAFVDFVRAWCYLWLQGGLP